MKNFTIQICNDCYDLVGDQCNNPSCVFCRKGMGEVATILDALMIRPIVNGERLKL